LIKTLKPIQRNYKGWVRDALDARDLKFTTEKDLLTLPAQVDLRSFCSPIEDQGQLGSCVSHSLAGALEFLENKDNKSFARMSRLFIYYNARALEGTVKSDSGCTIRDAIKTLVKQGDCPETDWPYTISKFKTKPSCKSYSDGLKDVITVYNSVDNTNLSLLKAALASGYPFAFGISVYSSFESNSVITTGIVPMPNVKKEQLLGGHALLAVGYDDTKQWFIVRNSWGTSFGDKGYIYIPYAYLTNSTLANDFWVITKDKGF
jgi:C1A family cysteine protease